MESIELLEERLEKLAAQGQMAQEIMKRVNIEYPLTKTKLEQMKKEDEEMRTRNLSLGEQGG